jgi:hypothetical protein
MNAPLVGAFFVSATGPVKLRLLPGTHLSLKIRIDVCSPSLRDDVGADVRNDWR